MTEYKAGMVLTGTIEKLALGGQGIVRCENFVVFTKGGIPGQVVEFQLTKKKENYAEAKILKIIKPSALETPSPYESMPGCSLQNISYPKQLAIKESQVFETLEHISGICAEKGCDFEKLPILPSPEVIRYRNKVEFSFGYASMWSEIGVDGKRIFHDEHPSLGFHPEGKWELVQPIQDCFLISEKLNRIREIVAAFFLRSGKHVWNPKIQRGFWRSLILREGKNTGEIFVNFVVSQKCTPEFWASVCQDIVTAIPQVTGILETVHTGRSDAITAPEITVLYGKETLLEKLADVTFELSPFSFFQTNTRGAEKLFATVQDFAALSGKEKILDLFCGSGAIGLFLAKNAGQIVGLEMDSAAVEDARNNARINGFENTEYFCGKAEKLLPELLKKHPQFDILIVDPPRAGMHPDALELLKSVPAKKCVYVSCNPATLARDAKVLIASDWHIEKVQPVDMFPHTPHVETVVLFSRRGIL